MSNSKTNNSKNAVAPASFNFTTDISGSVAQVEDFGDFIAYSIDNLYFTEDDRVRLAETMFGYTPEDKDEPYIFYLIIAVDDGCPNMDRAYLWGDDGIVTLVKNAPEYMDVAGDVARYIRGEYDYTDMLSVTLSPSDKVQLLSMLDELQQRHSPEC